MALTGQQMQPVAHRYTARGAVALELLAEDATGDLIYAFHRPCSDGTTGIKLSPLKLLKKTFGVRAPATCPLRPLCRVSGATQHASRCDHPHTVPSGCGRRGNEDGNPLWEVGATAERVV
jgi:hypothetical protein